MLFSVHSCFRRGPANSPESESDDEEPAPRQAALRVENGGRAHASVSRISSGREASTASPMALPGRAVLSAAFSAPGERRAASRGPLTSLTMRGGSRVAVSSQDGGVATARASGGLSDFLALGRERSAALAASRSAVAAAPSSSAPAAPAQKTSGTDLTRGGRRDTNGLCGRCDKDHDTADCPHYKKARENHPDALRRKPLEMGSAGGNFTLTNARVVRQPGDGSCLYHSLAYGLGDGNASRLRRELADWVEGHSEEAIAETPLRDWVKWDSGSSVREYARRIAVGGWGGGIEMAACARLKRVNVHVYERAAGGGGFKRISCFDSPQNSATAKTVHVLYCGGVHYDALVPGWSNRL